MDHGRVVFDSGLTRVAAPGGGGAQMLLFGGGGGGNSGGSFFRGDLTGNKRPFFTTHEELLEEEYYDEQASEKKRRLTAEQVKMLEMSFEEENKLEPERKGELAQRLGMSPRQVAVWFQNRRARWKTKQLEHDFDRLKAAYDALAVDHRCLLSDNDRLREQVISLTDKLHGKETLPSATACAAAQEVDQPDCATGAMETPPSQNLKEDIIKTNDGVCPVVIDVAEGTHHSGTYFAGNYGYNSCAGQHGSGAASSEEEDGSAVSDVEGCSFHLTDALFAAAAGVGHRATEEEEAQIRSWAASSEEEDGSAVSDVEGCSFHLTDALFAAAAGVGHRATEEEEAQIRSWASWFWND